MEKELNDLYNSTFTSTAGTMKKSTFTVDDLKRAMEEIEKFGLPNKEWILIDPQGNAWKSENVLLLAAKLMSQVQFDPLPQDMSKILHDNIGELYER